MERCPSCDKEFSRVTSHWGQSDCGYPELTERQKKIATGLVMGDADVLRTGGNPSIRVRMTNKKFLNWLKEEFGCLATDITLEVSGEEALERNKHSDFIKTTEDTEVYKDLYRVVLRANMWYSNLAEWYDTGEKVWPDDISFEPLTVKMWYVCDGWYDESSGRPAIRANNESENLYEHIGRFKQVGLEPTKQSNRDVIRFNKSKADKFFEYIGEPVPGFEYKWSEWGEDYWESVTTK